MAVIYKQSVTPNVRLNAEAVGLTKADKTQSIFALLCAVLILMSYIS